MWGTTASPTPSPEGINCQIEEALRIAKPSGLMFLSLEEDVKSPLVKEVEDLLRKS
jgi:hypothetical protein